MGTILKSATLVEFEPASVEVGDLRIEGGRIVGRGPDLPPQEGDEVIPLHGKLVMPGLVSAHHRLYATLARGMPGPTEPVVGDDFEAQQQATTWRLEDALDLDAVQAAATAGGLEALGAGTTCVFDSHASPSAIRGSLVRLARGLNEVGLRAVLSYQVSDRGGALQREEGLEETVGFQQRARGRFRGMIGAHASFTLSHEALEGLSEAVKSTGAGLHIGLAEDPADERLSFERFGEVPVARLMSRGLVGPTSLLAHVVHLSWPELSQVISTGAWLVHTARANMLGQAGYAPAGKFGSRAAFGTAGSTADVFAEAQAAWQRSNDAGQPISILRYLANGHRIASQAFGDTVGPLREGAVADLLVLDYRSPTPLTGLTLPSHLVEGLSARNVESVMIDGVWRLWARRPLSINADAAFENARSAADAVWSRMAERVAATG